MTVAIQRTRSVLETGRFLRDLVRGRYRVPKEVRDTAAWLERHCPTGSDLFMAAHGSGGVFADPHNAGDPIELPAPPAPGADVRLGSRHWDSLIAIVNCAPVPVDFDVRRWLEQWLDIPNPALHGETPGSVAARPGGFDVVQRVLMAVLDSSLL